MANRRTESNQSNAARSRLASFLLVLLPGFMFLGLLAPAAVTVEYEGEEETIVPVTFRNFRMNRHPLLSRQIGRGVAAEFSAIGDVFVSGARLIAKGAKDAFRLPRLDTDNGNAEIVLDDGEAVENYVVGKLFDGSGQGALLAVDFTPIWNEELFDRIPPPLRTAGFRQDDDFAGEAFVFSTPLGRPVEVPEPGTGVLIGLGLTLLALRRPRA